MKRAFRAATVFTGTAAVAAAMTPTAGAAATAPGATGAVTPATVAKNCATTNFITSHLVLNYSVSEKHPHPACVTGIGTTTLGTKPKFSSYCAGKYSSFFWIQGVKRGFTAGWHHLGGQAISKIQITKSVNKHSGCRFFSIAGIGILESWPI
jgi:hypothetical protein